MKFSVITVCLNSANTIERTIQSVLAQKGVELEYIIMDGGSDDGTVEIIKKYEDRISFWKSEADKGLYDAMNKGIEMASGDIISFLNSDDWYEKDILEKIKEVFSIETYDMVSGRVAWIKNNEIIGYNAKEVKESDIYINMIYHHSALFAKKELFLQYGKFDLHYKVCADYEWLLRVYAKGARIKFINFVIVNFSLGGFSSGKECNEERKEISFKYLPKDLEKQCKDKIEEFYQRMMEMYYFGLAIKIINSRADKKEELIKRLSDKSYRLECCNLFGLGQRAYDCIELLDALKIHIGNVYDNSVEKQTRKYFGKRVKEPRMISNNNICIITSTIYENEIEEQLKSLGIENYVKFSEIIRVVADFGKVMCKE